MLACCTLKKWSLIEKEMTVESCFSSKATSHPQSNFTPSSTTPGAACSKMLAFYPLTKHVHMHLRLKHAIKVEKRWKNDCDKMKSRDRHETPEFDWCLNNWCVVRTQEMVFLHRGNLKQGVSSYSVTNKSPDVKGWCVVLRFDSS